jgi:hypothetical protein
MEPIIIRTAIGPFTGGQATAARRSKTIAVKAKLETAKGRQGAKGTLQAWVRGIKKAGILRRAVILIRDQDNSEVGIFTDKIILSAPIVAAIQCPPRSLKRLFVAAAPRADLGDTLKGSGHLFDGIGFAGIINIRYSINVLDKGLRWTNTITLGGRGQEIPVIAINFFAR